MLDGRYERDKRDMTYSNHRKSITQELSFHPTSRLARFTVSPLFALCIFSIFLAPSLEAHAELTTSDLIARVQDHYDRTRSLTADFVQETRSRTASLGTTARGKLYFLKPGAIRWDYEEPLQQFVVNEENAWLYVPDEKAIYLYEVKQIISSPIVLSFFSGLGKLSDMFSISQLPADPGPPTRYRLELLPRESESPVSRVTLWVSSASYYVVRIQTEDPLGNINEVSFTNIQVDLPLEPSWFALEVPKGVRVEQQEASPR
jgi:outer membrane lipoprotein carrier protein